MKGQKIQFRSMFFGPMVPKGSLPILKGQSMYIVTFESCPSVHDSGPTWALRHTAEAVVSGSNPASSTNFLMRCRIIVLYCKSQGTEEDQKLGAKKKENKFPEECRFWGFWKCVAYKQDYLILLYRYCQKMYKNLNIFLYSM